MIVAKTLSLPLLEGQLAAAGVTVRGLGTRTVDGQTDLHTYDASGGIIDVPPAAAGVVSAHTAPVIAPPDWGPDLQTPDEFAAQAAAAVANLRGFIAVPTPTNAQVIAVVKLLCRIALVFIRRAM